MKDLVAEHIPWVVYEAADWLRETIKPAWRIFEWGSGGSTTFFLEQRAFPLVTVEHDKGWHDKVSTYVKANYPLGHSWMPYLLPPTNDKCPVTSARHPGCFANYASLVLQWSDLDLVFVDGRARNHCAKLAAPRIKPGGWLVLDNSDRADYKPTFDLLKGWPMVTFTGHGPLSDIIWSTTCWQKPGAP